ncbi:hypothetical protein [Streptomyces olivochromogenes]|uniref:hypothetical protein n=1 Tax=Streptomyces olivochromogenes TaxID=1963 RepID=UPI001F388A56|nr:hypothetical protein [Streptomyces olivochromogenes]MCF3135616.1 hypothetical protein [Streptomyces olivochromogenes]
MKSILGAGIAGVFCVMSLAAVGGTASAAENPTSTPSAYMAWLAGQESENPGGGAAETLGEFKALSEADQVEFLHIIGDPGHVKDFLEFASRPVSGASAAGSGTKVLNGGDVVLETESGGADGESSAEGTADASGLQASSGWRDGFGSFGAIRAGDRSAWYTKTDKVMGVKVSQVRISVLFHKNNTKIDKIYKGEAGHRNFVPFSEFSNTKPDTWIDARGLAHASTVWTAKLETGSSWTASEEVWCNKAGGGGGALV